MSNDYTLDWSDSSLKPPFVITGGTTNTAATSLTLIGKGTSNWGEPFQENFLHLLENFASDGVSPSNPTMGQLWYDASSSKLKVYDGSSFIEVLLNANIYLQQKIVRFNNNTSDTSGLRDSNVILQISGGNTSNIGIQSNTWGGFETNFENYSAGGTFTTPTATPSNTTILSINGRGYDGSSYSTNSKVAIKLAAKNTWTLTDNSTKIVFEATPINTTTSQQMFEINGNEVIVGTDPGGTASFKVGGSSRFNSTATFSSNITIGTTLSVGTNATISGTLGVTGDTTLNNTNIGGNLTFANIGTRILGNYSSAVANRPLFQTNSTNANSFISTIPNGTANLSQFSCFNNSNPTNSSYVGIEIDTTSARLFSGVNGVAGVLPLEMAISGVSYTRLYQGGTFIISNSSLSSNLVGTTLTSGLGVSTSGNGLSVVSLNDTSADAGASHRMITLGRAGGEVGSITTTGSTTSYNTSSDYRLKQNIVPLGDGAIEQINQISVKQFSFKRDEQNHIYTGFLAHELQEIVPDAVSGVKDEKDDKGNNLYQSVDYSKLVPILTKALQEALSKIDGLTLEIEILKDKVK